MKERLRSFFTFFTYRKKLSLAFLSLLILPMLMISFLLIQTNIRENETQLINYYSSITEREMENVIAVYNNAMQRINAIDHDSRLHAYLNSIDNNLIRLVEISYYFHSLYQSLIFGEPGMEVTIYRSGTHFLPEGFVKHVNMMDPSLLEECEQMPSGSVMIRYGSDRMYFYKVNRRFGVRSFIVTEVSIPFNRVRDVFNNESNQAEMAVILWPDTGEAVLLSGPDDFSYKNNYLFIYTINQSGWVFNHDRTVSFIRDANTYYPDDNDIGKLVFHVSNAPVYAGIPLTVAMLIGLFASVVVLVLYMSRRLTRRLYSVIDQIQQRYEVGDGMRIDLDSDNNDEFRIISDKLNELFDTIHQYYENIKNISLENKELETQLLQDLINPHFLYNTLDSIKWQSNEQKVPEVVDSLIDYYRISLNRGMLYLTIENEISLLIKYLNLQKFAYESDFKYEIDIDPDIEKYYTIKHILQPFAENSILHGIDKTGENGKIIIRGSRDNNDIVFEIEDNGCGIDPEKLKEINTFNGETNKNGYGITNVNKRITNLYGPKCGIKIFNAKSEGIIAQIRIPVIYNP